MADALIVVAYLAAMAIWGIARAGKRSGQREPREGRSAAAVFAALTASFLGGGFSFGLAAKSFSGGVGHVVALWGFSLGTVVVGLVVAPALERFRGCRSVGELMGTAYGPAARAAVGLLASFFCCAVLGAQLRALGLSLGAWLNMDWRAGMAMGLAVLLALVVPGGSSSVVSAAPVQCTLLLAAFALTLLLGVFRAGGVGRILAALPPDRLSPFTAYEPAALCGAFLMFMTGETLAPPYVQRLLEGGEGNGRRGAVTAGLVSVVVFSLAGAVGLIALVLFPAIEPGMALPMLLKAALPPVLRGLGAIGILSGLFAAGGAFLTAAASNLAGDVLPPLLPRSMARRRESILRAATALLGVGAGAVAIFSPGVLEALTLAYRLWAPAVTAPLCALAFSRRLAPAMFWGSAIAGILTMIVWELTGNPFGIPSAVSGIMVSIPVCMVLQREAERCPERKGFFCSSAR